MAKPKSKSNQIPTNKPFPVRLGDAKPKLQQMAFTRERSLHWLIKKTMTFVAEEKIILPF
jgi:hypothetical protein